MVLYCLTSILVPRLDTPATFYTSASTLPKSRPAAAGGCRPEKIPPPPGLGPWIPLTMRNVTIFCYCIRIRPFIANASYTHTTGVSPSCLELAGRMVLWLLPIPQGAQEVHLEVIYQPTEFELYRKEKAKRLSALKSKTIMFSTVKFQCLFKVKRNDIPWMS